MLTTILVNFSDKSHLDQLLQNGFMINNLFLPGEKYIKKKQPTRCYNCQKFGHTANFCLHNSVCTICATPGHNNTACSKPKKCANCGGSHTSADRECPIYLKHLETLLEKSFLAVQ